MDITSLVLGMKTTTELCRQKCRRTQASSHKQVGIYIRGVLSGGGVYSMGCNTVQHRCGQLRVTKCAFCYKNRPSPYMGLRGRDIEAV